MTIIWNIPAGTMADLGSAEEETDFSYQFPVVTPNNTEFTLESGDLPPGIAIKGSRIVGKFDFISTRVSKIYVFQIRATIYNKTVDSNGVLVTQPITSNRFFKLQVNVNFWKFDDSEVYDAGSVEEGGAFFFTFPVLNPKNTEFTIESGSLPNGLDIIRSSITGTATPSTSVIKTTTFEFTVKGTFEQEIPNEVGAPVIIVSETTRRFKIILKVRVWSTINSTYNYGSIPERRYHELPLPITPNKDFSNITFTLTSGKLPPGLRIEGTSLVGSPFEVPCSTEFRFVIRAVYENVGYDKTFTITIEGADEPRFVTPQGLLNVGVNDSVYILDTSYVDFKIDAIDNDTASGQQLTYSIFDGDGELPPGLILTDDGRIVGFIQPLLAVPWDVDNGNYDTSVFDGVMYDFGFRSTNGYDHWVYDLLTFDAFTPGRYPNKLNRNYQFNVTVSDGDNISTRLFRIFVVGEDHFRADSEVHQLGQGIYTADVSFVKAPIWTTPNYLGVRRANNYQIFKLDTYYHESDVAPVMYSLDRTNPGVYQFTSTGEITHNGKFEISEEWPIYPGTGLPASSPNEWTVLEPETYSRIPPGMQFDTGSGEVLGYIPFIPAVTKQFKFTVTATRYANSEDFNYSSRTFTVDVVGELEQSLNWITPFYLGEIDTDMLSNLFVRAESAIPNSTILYSQVGGVFPPGLTINLDGEIVGKVNQVNTITRPGVSGDGLLTIDGAPFTMDNGTTTVDHEYTIKVKAVDSLNYSELVGDFVIRVNTPNTKLYSNIIVKPFISPASRSKFRSFINDSDIFDVTKIYRPNDPNFGIQEELKMLVYGGIETRQAIDFVTVVTRNHKRKRFTLGDLKVAQAKLPGTTSPIYELIYIDVLDPLEIGKVHLPERIAHSRDPHHLSVDQDLSYHGPATTHLGLPQYWKRPEPFPATIDSTAINVNDLGNRNRYPSSISLWRKRIREMGLAEGSQATTDRNYLPLWMRTIQDGSVRELGFIKAIPLCYCKPGESKEILANIKRSNFDFKQLSYVVDRYIIDRLVENDKYVTQDKYIAFPYNRITI
jgi:hypothetical protein